jgi:hypothetical protein
LSASGLTFTTRTHSPHFLLRILDEIDEYSCKIVVCDSRSETESRKDGQVNRRMDREAGEQTDRQTYKHTNGRKLYIKHYFRFANKVQPIPVAAWSKA